MDWFDSISNCQVQSDNDIEKLVEYFEICDVKDVSSVTQALQTFASMCTKSNNEGTTYLSVEGLRVILKLLERSSSYRIKQWCFVALNAAIENNANYREHLRSPTTFATVRVVLYHSNLIPSFQINALLQNTILFLVHLVLNKKSGQDLARKSGCLGELKRLYQETFPIFRNTVTNFPSNWGSKPSLDTWQFINNALINSMSDPDNEENQNICASLQTFCFHMIESSNDWLIIKQIATFLNSVISNNEEIKCALRSMGVFHVLARSLTRVMKEFDTIEDNQTCEDALLSLLNLYISMIKDHPTNAFHGLKLGFIEKLLEQLANPNICVEAKTLAVYILSHSVNISNTRNVTQTTEDEDIMSTNMSCSLATENLVLYPTIKRALDSSDDISNLFANKSPTQNPQKPWYFGDSTGNTKTLPKILQVPSNEFEFSPVDHLKFLKIDGTDSIKSVDQLQNASPFHTSNDSNDSSSSLMDNPFKMIKRFCPTVSRQSSQTSSEGFVPITSNFDESSKLDINSFVDINRNETVAGEKRLDLQHENLFLQNSNTDKIDSIRNFSKTSSLPIIAPLKLVLPETNSEKIQKKTHSLKILPSVQSNPLLLSEPKVVSPEQRNINVASISTTSIHTQARSHGQSSPMNDVPQTILELDIVTTQVPPQNSLLKPSDGQSSKRNEVPLKPPQTILESAKELDNVPQVRPSVPPRNSLLKPESNAQKPTKRLAKAEQTLSTRSEYKISQAQPKFTNSTLVKAKNMPNKTTTIVSSVDSSTINVFKNKAPKIIHKRCSLKTGLTIRSSISNANESRKPILLSQFETPTKGNLAFADSSSKSSDTRNMLKPVPVGHDKLKRKRFKKPNDELKKKNVYNLTEFERLDDSSESRALYKSASNILKNQSDSDIATVNKPERNIICAGCNTPEELGLERVDCRNYKAMLEIHACPYHKLKLELEARFLAWYHGAREEYLNSQTFH